MIELCCCVAGAEMHLHINNHHLNNSNPNDQVISLPVTTRNLLERKLCSNNEISLSNVYLAVDEEWTVQYWNEQAATLTGIPSGQIVGNNLWKSLVLYLPASLIENYQDKPISAAPVFVQLFCTELNCRLSSHTWQYSGSLFISITHVPEEIIDVSEKFGSPLELYKLVTEISNDCCWDRVVGTQEIFWIDGGHQRIFGYPIQNKLVPQLFWEECIHPDDRERVTHSYNETIASEQSMCWECEYQFMKADGQYIYVLDRAKVFRDSAGSITHIIGTTQDIHQRKLAELKLVAELLSRQHEISRSVLIAQEQERALIGEELNNNLGQILAAAKMYIQSAGYTENKDAYIEKALSYIVDVMNEIRRISRALVIPPPAIISLSENIRILVLDFNLLHGVKINYQHNLEGEDELPELLQTNIFRIVQEHLSNIGRHSGASQAVVSLEKNKGLLRLLITDNGKGLQRDKDPGAAGFINIRSRVELHKGQLQIVSPDNKGLIMEATFPLA